MPTRILYGFLTVALVFSGSSALAATLTVNVEGIDAEEGHIMMAVNATEAQFDGTEDPVVVARLAVDGEAVSNSFNNLSPGTYAVRVFHDLDGDEKIKTNFLGIPSEPWGISNNPSGSFGPPKWPDAAFELPDDGATITITLN